jgi:class I fructose-bisphosphate aldolase
MSDKILNTAQILDLLGKEGEDLLNFSDPKISKDSLIIPSGDFVDKVFINSDRNNRVLGNLNRLYHSGRLSDTGYLSIFPVDQGIEHSGGASFAKNIDYFNPEKIIQFAVESGSNGVASTLGVLSLFSRKYAHKIPFIVKINHNELLSYPNIADQTMFASAEQAYNMGAAGIGATIYFGSQQSRRQIKEVSEAFAKAHELGMFTILWCYLRNDAFKSDKDYHQSSDLTGQANHIGVTIDADIIKQKLPVNNGGYKSLNMGNSTYGKFDESIYSQLNSENPIDLTRYQLLNNYAGNIPLINSGGGSGENDLAAAVKTAIINKRAGGSGLILGRKAFQKPLKEGLKLVKAVQDVYLNDEITIA